MQRPLPNSYWVVPGKLLAGEYPLGRSGADGRLRLTQLVAAGVSLFIDLTETDECPPYESLLPEGAAYVRLPVADQSVPGDIAVMQRIQAEIAAAIGTGQCVYVHCRAGIGRTGTAVGCFLSEQGLEPAPALERLNELWRQSARAASWPTVPQTEEQAEYIRRWRRRPDALAAAVP
ncbi:MAG TPA: dual specificity protein phosphatase family protein, partial [Steroidobacteraceae bacterium]|nr:dual specificity protein phosphatase family protein [Steroidobacteraceae bacterium]